MQQVTMVPNKRFAVLGNPIEHSLSPRIHAHFAQQCAIDMEYLAVPVATAGTAFETTVRDFFTHAGSGLNITLPFKARAATMAATSSEKVQLSGAANTLFMHHGKLHAENTDGMGLVTDIQRLQWQLQGSRLVILGAGGAVAGILAALLETGIRSCVVLNRNPNRAATLVKKFLTKAKHNQVEIAFGSLDDYTGECDLMLNALGVSADFDYSNIVSNAGQCYDLNYSLTQHTPFCQAAKKHAIQQCSDGLGMLVFQAAEAFFLWHAQRPNAIVTLAALRDE